MARFISAVHLPFYIASGFFKLSFAKVLFYVMTSAALYLSIAFGLFHIFGEIAGEKMRIYLPILAFTFLIIYFLAAKFKKT